MTQKKKSEHTIVQSLHLTYTNRGCQSYISSKFFSDQKYLSLKTSGLANPNWANLLSQNAQNNKSKSFLFAVEWTCRIQKNPLKMPGLSNRATFKREFELAECWVIKAYLSFCFNDEDSSEDDIDYCILAELAVLKA